MQLALHNRIITYQLLKWRLLWDVLQTFNLPQLLIIHLMSLLRLFICVKALVYFLFNHASEPIIWFLGDCLCLSQLRIQIQNQDSCFTCYWVGNSFACNNLELL